MGWQKRRGHAFRTVAPHPEKRGRKGEASGEEHKDEAQQTWAHMGEEGPLGQEGPC